MREMLPVFVAALFVVVLVTVTLHERHYAQRRLQLMEGRLRSVESILLGDHLS